MVTATNLYKCLAQMLSWCQPLVQAVTTLTAFVLPGRYSRSELVVSLQWRHNEHDGVSNHQPYDCLLNRLSWRRSKKTSKLRVTGFCAENSPVTGEFPAQRASNAENVSIWWRHRVKDIYTAGRGWGIFGVVLHKWDICRDRIFSYVIRVAVRFCLNVNDNSVENSIIWNLLPLRCQPRYAQIHVV